MSPTNKPGMTNRQRSTGGGAVVPDELSVMEPSQGGEVLGPVDELPPRQTKRSWRRVGSVGLLAMGLIAGVFLALHSVSVNKKQAALKAAQSDQSLQVKPQSIGLSSLGLKSISALQQTGTLTVNGQLNVADSVVLEPTAQPNGAVAGQLFYDQQKNQLGYYNDKGVVYLQGGSTSVGNTSINNVYNVYNVSNVSNISNITNMVTGPPGVIPMFNGSGLSDSLLNESGNGVAVGATANTTTRFTITGATSDNTTSALIVADSAGDTYAQVTDNGQVNLGKGPGAALGNTVIEPTRDTGINGIITADKFTTTNSVTVVSMSVYVGTVASPPYNQFQLGIYKDNAGAPGAWVASSAVGTLAASTWNTLPISTTLAAGTSYWLAYTTSSSSSTSDDPYYTTTSSGTHAYATFTFGSGSASGMPASYPTPTTVNDVTHSVYATVVGSGSVLTLDTSGTMTTTGPAVFKDVNNSATAFQVQNSSGTDALSIDTNSNNVGVGTSSATGARLSVVGATNDSTTKALSVSSSTGVSLATVGDDGSVGLGESRPVIGNASSGNYTGCCYYNGSQQLLQAQSFTTTNSGAVNSITTYIGQPISSTNKLYQMAIYADNAGVPGTYIASTAVSTLTGTGWTTLPIAATLSASTKYWLVYWTNVNDSNHNGQNFISGYSGPNTFVQSNATWQSGASNGMPTTFPAGGGPSGSYETSIYVSYAAPVSALTLDATGSVTSNGAVDIQNSSGNALEVNDQTGGTAFNVDAANKQVAINGTNSGGFTLGVWGNVGIDSVSTTALELTGASGQALLTADTVNEHLVIGPSGGDTVGALLELGTKTTAGDPAELDGAMYYNGNTKSFRCGEAGMWVSCSGLVFANTSVAASDTVSNTAATTNFAENYTIPANACQPGRVYDLTAQGVYTTDTTTNSVRFDVKLDATSLATSGAVTVPTSKTNYGWRISFQIVCDTTGTTGTIEAQGYEFFSTSQTGSNALFLSNGAPITIDTTTAHTLQLAPTWNVAAVGDSVTLRQFIVRADGS